MLSFPRGRKVCSLYVEVVTLPFTPSQLGVCYQVTKKTSSSSPSQMKGTRSSSSPCAACKFLKRRCTPDCTFAPYFRSDESQKFANVHKVFGASNVTKILNEVPLELRGDAVDSLAYEAEARLRDPVFGCVGDISLLQWKMVQLQEDLANARVRLARYVNAPSSSSQSMTSSSCDRFLHDWTAFATQLDLPVPNELGSSSTSMNNVS